MNDTTQRVGGISLRRIFERSRYRLLTVWGLVCVETIVFLAFPLVIGAAIDDLLQSRYVGWMALVGLGFFAMLVGAARRFYDARLYATIHQRLALQLAERGRLRGTSAEALSARLDKVQELVFLLQDACPKLITRVLAMVGAILLLFVLQPDLFIACVMATTTMGIVYGAIGVASYTVNRSLNDALEKQPTILSGEERSAAPAHFKRIAAWNTRLSDLETLKFTLSWVVIIGVLGYAIIVTVQSGITAPGKLLSILMVVFQYIGSIMLIPLSYQQGIRLREILRWFDRAERALSKR
ncbi:MAG: ABC transporter six-transmembrane domain-containing protein [Myxococcota bacterium]